MTGRARVAVVMAFAALAAPGSAILASEQADAAEDVRARVALIDSTFASGRHDRGAGLVVGYRGESVLIATAAHVVRDQEDAPFVSVEVSFPWDRRVYDRMTLVERNRELDVALLWLVAPEVSKQLAEFPLLCSGEPRADERVVTIGHRLDETWAINRVDRVIQPTLSGDTRRFVMSSAGIAPGNSGGPVLGEDGCLLGLVTNRDAEESRATSADQALALLPGGLSANLMGGESSTDRAGRADTFTEAGRVLNKYLFDLEALPALFKRSKVDAEELRRTIEAYNASYAAVYDGRAGLATRLGEYFGRRRGADYGALVSQIDAVHKTSVYIKLNDAVILLRTNGKLSGKEKKALALGLAELDGKIPGLRSSVDAYLALLQPLVKTLVTGK